MSIPNIYKRARFALIALVSISFVSPGALANSLILDRNSEILPFMSTLSLDNDAQSVWVEEVLGKARIKPALIESISKPAEGLPWYKYRPIFIKSRRIDGGVKFYQDNVQVLQRASKVYGVPPEIITAIIGVETYYGKHKGKHNVLDSLATLGFRYPPRAKFFKSELREFIQLNLDEGLDPYTIKGSYAGAMGVPQFISSSYRRYAVDFDHDGIRDLFSSVDDAIGSVANYLATHKWRRDKSITFKVSVDQPLPDWATDLHNRVMVKRLRALGLDIPATVSDFEKGAVLTFKNRFSKEYWLVLDNFYSITRYNHSKLYALAVYQLAQEINTKWIAAN